MSRTNSITKLSRRVCWLIIEKAQRLSSKYGTMIHSPNQIQSNSFSLESPKDRIKYNSTHFHPNDSTTLTPHQIGENVPRKDKITFLVNTLMDIKDSKEEVYSTLDAWVAWERNFPIGALKNVLLILEKDQQWHRMVQVIKWMLSKGQGNTRGTYGQLIQALDMDDRAEEAYEIWKKKLAFDLHSVPWKLCKLMISIYYRNNRLEDLVKLFNGLEDFDRKPPEKSIVRKVADAYEILGKPEEKERILEKYKDLFTETANGKAKKQGYITSHKRKSGKKG
ncbi:pentatricopeptide repeat-containing protein At4g18975, chloroplastic [Primulina tabacum]|uniref:pentatricopeptide repeat-containing protein At4g18975, chloroplastic n=1 Tax=Primulina tabacum TaxID=48773 RepID=UPI003F5AD56B